MPVNLNDPIVPVTADAAKVAAFKVEDNVEQWLMVWVCQGTNVEGAFMPNPMIPVLEFKIEDGNHPLYSGRSLRRCPVCHKWYGLETVCPDDEAETLPYDGFTRINMRPPEGATLYLAIKDALYSFLTTEAVPVINLDGTLGESAVLLPASE